MCRADVVFEKRDILVMLLQHRASNRTKWVENHYAHVDTV